MSIPLATIQDVERITRTGRSTIWALFVIQLQEWLTLLDDEYELIIDAPRTFFNCLYLGCRYYPIVTWPVITWCFVGDHDPKSCGKINFLLYILLIPYQLLSQLVMIFRSWAFAGRKTFIAVILGSLYLGFVAAEIWVFVADMRHHNSRTVRLYTTDHGCFRSKGEADLLVATRTAILFIIASAIDLCCIIITWLHCLSIRSTQGSLGRSFLVQGFSTFLLLGTIHLVSAAMAISEHTALFSGGFLLPIPLVLCNIVACRLVLNVRRRAYPTEAQISHRISNIVRNDLAFIEESSIMSKTSTLVA